MEFAFFSLMRQLLRLTKAPWLDADADNEYKEYVRDIEACIKTMNKKGRRQLSFARRLTYRY